MKKNEKKKVGIKIAKCMKTATTTTTSKCNGCRIGKNHFECAETIRPYKVYTVRNTRHRSLLVEPTDRQTDGHPLLQGTRIINDNKTVKAIGAMDA